MPEQRSSHLRPVSRPPRTIGGVPLWEMVVACLLGLGIIVSGVFATLPAVRKAADVLKINSPKGKTWSER